MGEVQIAGAASSAQLCPTCFKLPPDVRNKKQSGSCHRGHMQHSGCHPNVQHHLSKGSNPSMQGLGCSLTWCKIHSMATLVLPAPVGAHMSKFSLVVNAMSYTALWMRFRDFMPLKAGCAQSGSSEISRSRSLSANGFGLTAGTCTSS